MRRSDSRQGTRSSPQPVDAAKTLPNLSVIAFPADQNPYQRQLYSGLALRGVAIHYAGASTWSRSANLVLLPLELVIRRLRGAQIFHLHWTFGFMFTGADRVRWLRRLSTAWYSVVLSSCRLLGLRIVWTLHNVLPHEQVFVDDIAARRRLLREADLVIAHSQLALDALESTIGTPRRAWIIPHGPVHTSRTTRPRSHRDGPLRLLFFGRIARYKGLEDLLLALAEVAETTSLTLTVAGECFEPVLSARIEALALRLPTRVSLRLERVPDDGVESLFHDHDVMILPYREATTSGAAILASEMAIPIVISDLPAFTDIPAIRRPPGVASLATVLRELEMMDRESLERFGAAARGWSEQRITWADVAEQTHRAFASLLDPRSDASTGPR